MVAKITVPSSIRRALNYNEQKMKEGKAECIYANNFLRSVEKLNFYEKLERFQSLINLNKRATTNSVHISLNFGVGENIERNKLTQIASVYMDKIGFGSQPYLVYQHLDAGHPHIHIVSTNIQPDGKRISLHNIGRNKSETARKELETVYNLQRAESQGKDQVKKTVQPLVQKLTYGRSATKRGITNVLDAVLPHYKYASLAELNAVLRLYNLIADRGKEDGIIYNKRGLVYRMLDEHGKKIGVPIKASSIYSQPTLPYLEKRFKESESQKQVFKKELKTSIDWIMVKPPRSLQAFQQALEKEKISLVVRHNDQGIVYGLTYVDHKTKSVFNGSDIGKEYSAKAILEKCGIVQLLSTTTASTKEKTPERNSTELQIDKTTEQDQNLSKIIEAAITPTDENQHVPFELRKRKKKRKRD